jgi:hypothetical protein
MMPLKLTCNQCGESLEVPEETRFLTCTACSSQLEVHRSGSTAYTEVLEAVEPAKLELELEKLDREWMEEIEKHHSSVPRLNRRQFAGWLALMAGMVLAFVGVWLHSLGNDARIEHMLHPWPWVCIGLGVFAVVGWAVFVLATGSDRRRIGIYNLAEQSYLYRRQQLLQKLEVNGERDEDQWEG